MVGHKLCMEYVEISKMITNNRMAIKDTDTLFEAVELNSSGDSISCASYGDGITITCEQPWAGDTETGFGRECSVRLDYKTAHKLGEWLLCSRQRLEINV